MSCRGHRLLRGRGGARARGSRLHNLSSRRRRARASNLRYMPEYDIFANFDRMRREMDELFGDVFERSGLARRRGGFSPPVDVAYTSDPPLAIVTAELAGVEIDALDLEIQGRKLILLGRRRPAEEGEVYQQVEI